MRKAATAQPPRQRLFFAAPAAPAADSSSSPSGSATSDASFLFPSTDVAVVVAAADDDGAPQDDAPVTTSTSTTTTYSLVAPMPGDNQSPPNAVELKDVSIVALQTAASVGWSTAPPRAAFSPSAVDYDLSLGDDGALQVVLTEEFENPYPDESMAVSFKVAKTLLCDGIELVLVSTGFQSFSADRMQWVDITAKIAYTATAEAVVSAVIESGSGQSAGLATSRADSFDAKLGPVGRRGRVQMRFVSRATYCYDAMSVDPTGSDIGQAKLRPIALVLPWAPLDDPFGMASVSFRLRAPASATILDPKAHFAAYQDLVGQWPDDGIVVAASHLAPDENGVPTFAGSAPSLPPKKTLLLFWLNIRNPDADWDAMSDADLPPPLASHAVVLQPASAVDEKLLTVTSPTPCAPAPQLLRVQLTVAPAQTKLSPTGRPQLLLNLTMTDSSGSTAAECNGATVRDAFNRLYLRRLFKRVSSLPLLVNAGVVRSTDIFADAVFVFDTRVIGKRTLAFRIDTVDVGFISRLSGELLGPTALTHSAAPSADAFKPAIAQLHTEPQRSTARSIAKHAVWILQQRPQGGTSFDVPARAAQKDAASIVAEARLHLSGDHPANGQPFVVKTFIDFDTDGGHNGGPRAALDAMRALISSCTASALTSTLSKSSYTSSSFAPTTVRGGCVTGFGAWVDQHTASRLAAVIGAPDGALLALAVPPEGSEGADRVFRRSFAAWVAALRRVDVAVRVAGLAAPYTHPALGPASVDAVQVVAVGAANGGAGDAAPSFAAVDVSDLDATGAVLQSVRAGQSYLLYVAARVPGGAAALAENRLRIFVREVEDGGFGGGDDDDRDPWRGVPPVPLSLAREPLAGALLGHEWLRVLAGSGATGVVMHNAVAVPRVRSRWEDDLSFAFNLPSPSGATSYLGRAKVDPALPAIDPSRQPAPPEHLFIDRSESALLRTAFVWQKRVQIATKASRRGGSGGTRGRGGGGAYRDRSRDRDRERRRSRSISPQGPAKRRRRFAPYEDDDDADDDDAAANNGYESPLALLSRTNTLQQLSTSTPPPEEDRDLRAALAAVESALKRFQRPCPIEFTCDGCDTKIHRSQPRFHCFDCPDFDECRKCVGKHAKQRPLHRVRDAGTRLSDPVGNPRVVGGGGPATAATAAAAEDPLVGEIFGPTPPPPPPAAAFPAQPAAAAPPKDRALEVALSTVRRFLGAVVGWYPLLQSMVAASVHNREDGSGFRKPLPARLPDPRREDVVKALASLRRAVDAGAVDDAAVAPLCGVAEAVMGDVKSACW